ncbi:tail fiber domain-containing protein [Tateyamaria sp. syn59]|uniref:tail fiber domain-containing protein n=1 Tax=Tateyamaria sp. syn59 TaxID=2576942 RepID=UPI001676BF09|nr:tail fiber domain-containing protein [Tateyamaria sp. syn59]
MKISKKSISTTMTVSALALVMGAGASHAQQVFTQDVIVQGSLCTGGDCTTSESFGFDTFRLKENNLRIHFDDTSASASFPANDWRLVANDSGNGGIDYFAIEDSTAGRIPFRVEAGARANALYMESDGDVGIGTSEPVVDLHVVDGNSPALRLDQDGSDGFNPQVYDIAANETNFFIRDVTNSSRLFFRAKPGAPQNSMFIAEDGSIGFGTENPDAGLKMVMGSGIGAGEAGIHMIDEQNSGAMQMLRMENDGAVQLFMNNTTRTDAQWMLSAGRGLRFIPSETASAYMMELSNTGDLEIKGALTQSSDRNAKTDIVPVDANDILAKVRALPVSAWTYKHEVDEGVRHIGPMAQDFYAAFGTGRDETGISSLDGTGVALAAIQALSAENAALKARLDALEAETLSE